MSSYIFPDEERFLYLLNSHKLHTNFLKTLNKYEWYDFHDPTNRIRIELKTRDYFKHELDTVFINKSKLALAQLAHDNNEIDVMIFVFELKDELFFYTYEDNDFTKFKTTVCFNQNVSHIPFTICNTGLDNLITFLNSTHVKEKQHIPN